MKNPLERALEMEIGDSIYYEDLPFEIHKYESCWLVLWNEPEEPDLIEKELKTEKSLRYFFDNSAGSLAILQ